MEHIGYIKYHGPHIQHGLFGAREAATALNGFDKMFRYFLLKEEPEFANLEFDIPVKISEGSWMAEIPQHIGEYMTLKNVAMTALTIYLTKTAAIAAKDGLFNTPAVKDIDKIMQTVLQKIQQVIRLVSHIKGFRKKIDHAKVAEDAPITIINDDGEEMSFPVDALKILEKCPPTLFSALASIVSPEQELEIGVRIAERIETVAISYANRSYFYTDDEDEEDAILPELKDGETVTLTGVVIRANESTQSIGFQYQEHTLTCKPQLGKTLADFKHALISQNSKHLYVPKMKMTGIVERTTPSGEEKDKIRIFFSTLEPEDAPAEAEPYTPDLPSIAENKSKNDF